VEESTLAQAGASDAPLPPPPSEAGWAAPIYEALTDQLPRLDPPAVASPAESPTAEPMHRSPDGSLLYPSLARSLVGGLFAIAVIVGGILAVNLMTRDGDKSSTAAPPSSDASATSSRSQSARPGKSSAATGALPTDGSAPPTANTPASKPATKATPAVKPTPAPSATATDSRPPAAVRRIPLTVLNNSRIRDLAKSAAGDFRAAGWPVDDANIGNTTYQPRVTTVYYLPGQEALARQLMRDVPGVRRMLLRPLGLPGHGLTVVVTREYAGG
jgi:hypothetical protein